MLLLLLLLLSAQLLRAVVTEVAVGVVRTVTGISVLRVCHCVTSVAFLCLYLSLVSVQRSNTVGVLFAP
uniref:Putative secreted protein n=1 Tax=Anopheles darlingi TaxID=43151 RepID=A0A2M4DIV6_ANODA